MNRRHLIAGALAAAALPGARVAGAATYQVSFTDDQWARRLTPDQFLVLRRAGTETPYTSALLHETRDGVFACVGCARPAFSSRTKYDSHTGWPSFWTPVPGAVATSEDTSGGMVRTEVHCATCGGHLGHVFEDGPPPTGLRYCMNGIALAFTPI